MNQRHIRRLRRALLGLAVLFAVWAGIVAATGGIVLHAFGVPITSRNPRNPLWALLISTVIAWALPAPNRRAALLEAWLGNAALARSVHQGTAWLRWADAARLIGVTAIVTEVVFWAGARPLWLDEQMIAINLRDRSVRELADPLWLGQAAPLGWLALQKVALVSFGTSELALRLVPMLFGCGLIGVAVWTARRTMGSVGAGLFVLLCAMGQWLSHYPFELKHYSADAFWGLSVPALTVWAMEAETESVRRRRSVLWWAAAAVGHWFSYGALLVTPPCALVLVVDAWRRGGSRTTFHFSAMGAAWLVSFGLHYSIALEHTATNDFLREYWSLGFPPDSAGVTGTMRWLVSRLEPLASHPGGTSSWMTFWLVALCGFAMGGPRLGVVLAAVPLGALALGVFRIVPLHDRLSLWIVPALYFGVALFVDRALRGARSSVRPWRQRLLAAVVLGGLALPACIDIVGRGWREYRLGRSPNDNRGLDDRAAVRWLMEQRRPGDVVMTTHLGVPAFWWYGGIPISGAPASAAPPDVPPILEVGLQPGSDCAPDPLGQVLAGRRRVLAYSGFPDQPAGFDIVLLARLAEFGTVIAERSWAISSHAAVIDLGAAPGVSHASAMPADAGLHAPPVGCLEVAVAQRW